MSYTAFKLTERAREELQQEKALKYQKEHMQGWALIGDHITVHMGKPKEDELEWIESENFCHATLDAFSSNGRISAYRVKSVVDAETGEKFEFKRTKNPHLTFLLNSNTKKEVKPKEAGELTDWVPLQTNIILECRLCHIKG